MELQGAMNNEKKREKEELITKLQNLSQKYSNHLSVV